MLVAILNAVQPENQCDTFSKIFDAGLVEKCAEPSHEREKINEKNQSCWIFFRNPRYEWSLGLL